jgi:hypothetical protein
METRIIPLSKGKFALVDDDVFNIVNKYKWTYTEPGYAYRHDYSSGIRKRIYMHRFILDIQDTKKVVDHINGNKLDNTKINLRVCTHKENIRNSGLYSDNTSGYKGVSFDKNRNKWISYISVDRKFKYLGRFNCKHVAGAAHNKAAISLYGDFAKLNPVEECSCNECVEYKRKTDAG